MNRKLRGLARAYGTGGLHARSVTERRVDRGLILHDDRLRGREPLAHDRRTIVVERFAFEPGDDAAVDARAARNVGRVIRRREHDDHIVRARAAGVAYDRAHGNRVARTRRARRSNGDEGRAILQIRTAAYEEPLDVRTHERRLIGNECGLEDQLAAVFDRRVDPEDGGDASLSVGLKVANRRAARIDEGCLGERRVVDDVAAGEVLDALRMREAHANAGGGGTAQIRKRKVHANRFAWSDHAAGLEDERSQTLDQCGRTRREDPGQRRRSHVPSF